uniref:Uncharacterized protein n=1 Tax=Sphaerodactylus townsendi TaxID=933632 RepID=A0ACB8GCK5_9SAUR
MGNCCQKHCACLEPYVSWLFHVCNCRSSDKYKTESVICNPIVISPPGPLGPPERNGGDNDRDLPPVPPPEQNCNFVALFDYQARTEDDLSFQAGDKLEVLDMSHEGWWFAKLLLENGFARPGQKLQGYIPSNYVAAERSIEAEPNNDELCVEIIMYVLPGLYIWLRYY